MQSAAATAELSHNGSITRPPPQQPVLYPVRLVYEAVIVNPGPEMQNQTVFMSPQPLMQWTPYANHTQPHISPMIPMPVQERTPSIPPWLQRHQVPVNQTPASYNQQYLKAPYGSTSQTPSYVLQNNVVPVAYATVNTQQAHPPNSSGATVLNQIRQTVPMQNPNYRIQAPYNVQPNQTNLANVAYNQARMARFAQVTNSTQFTGQPIMAKANIRPNQAALPIRKNQEINRVSQSTMTNTSYYQNRKLIRTQTVQTTPSRMPLWSNIDSSRTNINNKTLFRPANPNGSYPRTVLNQSSNIMSMNPPIRQNVVKLESPSTTNKVPIPVNGCIKDNNVIGIVNTTAITKESNANSQINRNLTSPPAFCSKGTTTATSSHTEVKTSLEINETPTVENLVTKDEDKSFSENENNNTKLNKRKNSFQLDDQKKMKGLEEIAHKVLTKMVDLHAVKENDNVIKDRNGVNNYLNVKEEIESSKVNELTIPKEINNESTKVDQNDSTERSKIPTTTTKILNHVIDGIVIQESQFPFKQELEENVCVENETKIKQSSGLNGNEENKVVAECNTDKQDGDLKRPRFNILSHVIDGIVIQESDVPFAIRIPLREKSRSINVRAVDSILTKNMQESKSFNKKSKEINESKDHGKRNKGRLQNKKDNTRERDINVDETQKNYIKNDDDDEIVTSILRNRLENEKDSKSEIVKSEKVEIATEDKMTVVSDKKVNVSNSRGDDSEDVPAINTLESVDAKRLKSWTCDELQSRLRVAWCPCFDALQHEEVDGRALLLAEERQLIDIGLHGEHARALYSLARRSSEN